MKRTLINLSSFRKNLSVWNAMVKKQNEEKEKINQETVKKDELTVVNNKEAQEAAKLNQLNTQRKSNELNARRKSNELNARRQSNELNARRQSNELNARRQSNDTNIRRKSNDLNLQPSSLLQSSGSTSESMRRIKPLRSSKQSSLKTKK